MTLKTFLSIISILAVAHGIAFLVAPEQVAKLYGMTSSPEVVLMARFFGGALVAWGAILWSTKRFSEEGAVRAVLLSTAVAEAIGVVTAVMGTVAGTLNAMGWLAVAIYAFGTVGCVYFLMGQKQLVTA
jgi:uncharacterized protein YjeT (DUF2065 family)